MPASGILDGRCAIMLIVRFSNIDVGDVVRNNLQEIFSIIALIFCFAEFNDPAPVARRPIDPVTAGDGGIGRGGFVPMREGTSMERDARKQAGRFVLSRRLAFSIAGAALLGLPLGALAGSLAGGVPAFLGEICTSLQHVAAPVPPAMQERRSENF